jgi:hypothetical protein
VLAALAGHVEAQWLQGGSAIPIQDYVSATNALVRVLQALGIARDPKLVNGTASADAGVGAVWPQFRADEAARAARDADTMAAQIAALGDDELESDELPAQEE